ncbi:MAG: MarR family transcriptional regulator [Conexibacter sp.]|nr:MarR family transcriptional regulator [Conexibacter sp.]
MRDPAGDVDRALADGLARLADAVIGYVAAVAASRGLAPSDVRAVGMIDRAGMMRPGELARALGISPSGTTGVINRLVAAGLLRRDGGSGNNHDVRLTVTDEAAADLPLAPSSRIDAAREIIDWPPDEREALVKFVLCLVELVERDVEAMRGKVESARAPEPAPTPPRWA